MSFTDIFIRRPVLALVVSLLILLSGLKAMTGLQIRLYPKLSNTTITVTTLYPGASPDLMQGFITTPISQAVSTAEGIDYLTASSIQGTSTVTAYIRLNYDPSQALTDIMAKVQQVKFQLPKESQDPVIIKSTGQTTAVMYIGFASPELSSAAISDYLTRVVQPLLATVDGVSSADILGGQTFAMRLWVDPARMAARGISASDVAAAIRANNFQSAAGQAKGYFTVTNVNADTGLTDVQQFTKMVVKAKDGAEVRMEDIASVDLNAKSWSSSIEMNGHHAVFIGVQATPTGNPLSLVAGIRALLPEIERNLPASVQMQVAYDSTKFIQASIDEVKSTLAAAVVIVIGVIFLFLGSLRAVLIPVVTIPLSLVGAGIIMAALGFSLNLLTLLAMVLAIGLVVDDAIVVLENVYRHIEEGKDRRKGAFDGSNEIGFAVMATTISLVAVFVPLAFLTGSVGRLFNEFGISLAVAVLISGFVALTLTPMLSSKILKPLHGTGTSWFSRAFDAFFEGLNRYYDRILRGALRHRGLMLAAAGAAVLASVVLFRMLPSELVPIEDRGYAFGVVIAPEGATLDYTDKYMREVEKRLLPLPERHALFTAIGLGFGGPGSVTNGFLFLQFKPRGERHKSQQQIVQELFPQLITIPGVLAFVINPPSLATSFSSSPIDYVLQADSYDELNKPSV